MMRRKDCDNSRLHTPRRILIALVLLSCGADRASAAVIRLHPTATAIQTEVRLGQVAELVGFSADQAAQLADLVVVEQLEAGREITITTVQINTLLAGNKVNLADVVMRGASRCTIRRPVDLTPANTTHAEPSSLTLEAQLRRYFEERIREYGGQLELSYGRNIQPLLLLSGPEYEFTIRPRSSRLLGQLELSVTIQHGLQPPQVEPVTVQVTLTREVVVAKRSINRSQTITAEDVRMEARSFQDLADLGLTDLQQTVGLRAKQLIATGDMIMTTQLEQIPLVQRNEEVRILSQQGGIALETTCKALESGTLGQVIRVRNETSRKVFQVKVTGLRRAEVFGESAALLAQKSRKDQTP
ncbi:MAG: hypothetical protein HJJLKODD_00479 [Phycisphaerae bacterium]|nr:hypothetical protein [Phycisphaerae bacterium]